MIRCLLAALVFAGLVAAAETAGATTPPIAPPSVVEGPLLARPTGLHVERVRLSFAFAEGARGVVSFEARYTVTNPSSAPEDVAVAFVGQRIEGITVSVDGAPAAVPTAAQHADAIEVPPSPELDGKLADRTAFRLVAAPGSRHEIRVAGQARGGEDLRWDGFVIDAVTARHLIASSPAQDVTAYSFHHHLVPSGLWQGTPPSVETTVTYPSGWDPPVEPIAGWETRREGARTVLTRMTGGAEARDVALRSVVPPAHGGLRFGGPLVAIGGTMEGNRGPRGRVGLELAGPGWLLYSLSADTDFRRRFIVTPLVEAASPALFFLPSCGLGVGVPAQVAPDPRPGVRIQGDMHFYPVGLVLSGDVYPRVGSSPVTADFSVLAQGAF